MKKNVSLHTRMQLLLCVSCALCTTMLHATITIIESSSQLEKEITSKPLLAVLEFYGSWCHVCQSIQKPFEAIADEAEFKDKVFFAQIDIDAHKDLKTKYGVLGVPTFIYFEKGKKKQQDMGVHNLADFKNELRASIKKHFKLGK